MQITVELQELYSYIPIIFYVLAGLAGVLVIMLWPKKKAKPVQKVPKPQKRPRQSITLLKDKYNRLLVELERNRLNNQITDRQASQSLSKIVRDFVYEATGIQVQNYTLSDIQAANMPKLYELIAQCYSPEFAADTNENIYELIKKARMVIGEWN